MSRNDMNTNASADAFKLLKKYNFNFIICNHYCKLPIHCACFSNDIKLLKWMINNSIFIKVDSGINCQTKHARNTPENGTTTLYIAVYWNCIESVDLLCK